MNKNDIERVAEIIAKVGDRGIASAGKGGIAKVLRNGVASAGKGGVILIEHWADNQPSRRVVGNHSRARRTGAQAS